MDNEQVCSDGCVYKSCEGPSLPDLDTGFFWDHNLPVSDPGLVMHHDWQAVPHSEILVEYTEVSSATLASGCHSGSLLSPSFAIRVQSPSTQNHTPNPGLTVPMAARASTPREGDALKKPALASSLDRSCIDLTAPWEVSLIRRNSDNSRYNLGSSLLEEPIWSPKRRSAFPSFAEHSSQIWSVTSPHTNLSDEPHKHWKEAVVLGCSPTPSITVSEDHWHRSVLLPYIEDKDLSLGD
ncbi:hypothetical protein AAFF_G00190530 [Aldrovandia affinis]|uniref:Uncharacterized protein n=1 Tax=Aldrovandia affinis TaxID=143900 RepID=A0AAD7RJN7_9TELE|nr:hypothetical protein AAFF_G00190530 [Aldrovandia affinis]